MTIIGFLCLLMACAGLYRVYARGALRVFFLPALVLKVVAGLGYGWLYVVYYGQAGDSFNYFHDAGKVFVLARQDLPTYFRVVFWHEYAPIWDTTLMLWEEPRAFWFVKGVSLLMFVTGENYWLLACYFSVLSFWGSWVLVEALCRHFPQTRLSAVVAFLFFPSVVFFGSGLTKESFAVALLGFGTAQLLSRFSWRTLPVLLFCAWSLLQLKFYYLALWAGSSFAVALAYPIARKWQLSPLMQVLTFVSILAVGFLGASFVFDFDELVLMIALNHNTTYGHSHPDDLVHYSIYGGQGYFSLNASWQSLLYNAPLALEAGLFRPYIWEASDKLKLVMSIENLGILIATILAFLSTFLPFHPSTSPPFRLSTLSPFRLLFFCGVSVFVVGLLVIIALASPNFGALVRYKVVVISWVVYGLGVVLWRK